MLIYEPKGALDKLQTGLVLIGFWLLAKGLLADLVGQKFDFWTVFGLVLLPWYIRELVRWWHFWMDDDDDDNEGGKKMPVLRFDLSGGKA